MAIRGIVIFVILMAAGAALQWLGAVEAKHVRFAWDMGAYLTAVCFWTRQFGEKPTT
jgi:hypothetical protein